MDSSLDMTRNGGLEPQDEERLPAGFQNGTNLPVEGRRWRIALYSHDTMGLGHMRRNLLIAQSITRSSFPVDILLVAGAREVSMFSLPAGVDLLSLPALHKGINGGYEARSLGLSNQQIRALRSDTIRAALLAFAPDLLIVDNVPRGALRELDATLDALRAVGRTRIVLGLRDVLDDPAVVAREWRQSENVQALRDFYHAVWVYGDPRVYDTVRAHRLPDDIVAKTQYTGYLDGQRRSGYSEAESEAALAALDLPPGRLVLCQVGGGQDGADLAMAFVSAEFPPDMNAVIVTGPYMPEETQQLLRQATEANTRMRLLRFLPEPTLLLKQAERVISMAGYNTVSEVLAFEKPTLLVPRIKPRREQLIRAERLCQLGLVDLLHPGSLNSGALSAWLRRDVLPSNNVRGVLDLNGLQRLPQLVHDLLSVSTTSPWLPSSSIEGQYVHVA